MSWTPPLMPLMLEVFVFRIGAVARIASRICAGFMPLVDISEASDFGHQMDRTTLFLSCH